jgi:hypothetical protein
MGSAYSRVFEAQHADSGELKGRPIDPKHARHQAKTAMANYSQQIVQKLWNYCNVLRDDGLSYGITSSS